jgi:DNA-binding NarL/FixJ family response regulator
MSGKDAPAAHGGIIIVEDDPSQRELFSVLLAQEYPALGVQGFATAEAALSTIDGPPAVVLMDIGLPGIGGLEATRRLLTLYPRTPVILTSVLDEEEYRREAVRCGGFAFIPKQQIWSLLVPAARRAFAARG